MVSRNPFLWSSVAAVVLGATAYAGCSGDTTSASSSASASSSGGASSGSSADSGSGSHGSSSSSSSSSSSGSGSGSGTGGGTVLVQTPGMYLDTCDGSGAVAIDATHFLDFNDENQVLGLYTQGASGAPVQTLDVSAALGLASGDETDFEDAARIGDRVYAIGSHGRSKKGKLELARYKFFALDLTGSLPNLGMKVAGSYGDLLVDMLDTSRWVTPDAAVITLLTQRSQLDMPTVLALAPKDQGTNIEGLAALPTAAHPKQMVIGFRNPQDPAKAILVTLLNADAVLGGAHAQFGEALRFDFGGNGVRGMAWSETHQALLLLSGPHDATKGPFALWRWSGVAGSAPVKVMDLTAPDSAAPEAVIPYPGTKDVQILFDMGTFQINGGDCKAAAVGSQYFTDTIVHVD